MALTPRRTALAIKDEDAPLVSKRKKNEPPKGGKQPSKIENEGNKDEKGKKANVPPIKKEPPNSKRGNASKEVHLVFTFVCEITHFW